MTSPIAAATILAQAFRFMEVTPPSSFDDDSEKARAAVEQYPTAMQQCLERYDWSFASTLAFLPPVTLPLTAAADPDLPYTFRLPGDLVRIHEVGDGTVRFRRDGIALRADDTGPLRLRYTAQIENETGLPATFRLAVSLHLAALLAPRWLNNQSKTEAIKRDAEGAIQMAQKQDARSASAARYDGLEDVGGDWVTEARR